MSLSMKERAAHYHRIAELLNSDRVKDAFLDEAAEWEERADEAVQLILTKSREVEIVADEPAIQAREFLHYR